MQLAAKGGLILEEQAGRQGRPTTNYRPSSPPTSQRAHWEPCSTVGGGVGGNISPVVARPWAVGEGVGSRCSPHLFLLPPLGSTRPPGLRGRRTGLRGPGVPSSDSDFVQGSELPLAVWAGHSHHQSRVNCSALGSWFLRGGPGPWFGGSSLAQRVCKVRANLSARSPRPGCSNLD